MKKLIILLFIVAGYFTKAGVLHVTTLVDGGAGSLREQINLALPGDTIDFTVSGTIQLDSIIYINKDLNIMGPGADSLEISGSMVSTQLFAYTSANIYMSGIFFLGGWAGSGSGGAMINYGANVKIEFSEFFSSSATLDGGGIFQDSGTFELNQCYFYNMRAGRDGGAIRGNGGSFLISSCTFEQCSSDSSGGTISAHGALFTIVNSTFADNNAGLDGGACAGDSMSFINCTFHGNSCSGVAGAVFTSYSYFKNTILSGNSGPTSGDVAGTIVSGGHNLIFDTLGLTGLDPTDIRHINPGIGNLLFGGLTPVFPLLTGSPCIDMGTCAGAPSLDQRDSVRIGLPDIGSYEFGGMPFLTQQLNDTICSGDTLFFGNNPITATGVYIYTFTSAIGCDSTIQLSVEVVSPDVTVTQANETLTASALVDSYQWFDCNLNSNIPSEVAQSFTAAANGSYAVIVSQSGCVDTSNCMTITNVGVENISNDQKILVYPSVVQEVLNIEFKEVSTSVINIYHSNGDLVFNRNYSDKKINIELGKLSAGIYLVEIINPDLIYRTKIMKE